MSNGGVTAPFSRPSNESNMSYHESISHPRQSTESNNSSAAGGGGGRGRKNSIRVPTISSNDEGTSPLAKAGIKGDTLMLFVTCFASLGVFLFGFDQGVMSAIITGPYFKAYFHNPTAYELGTMVAILEIGALITSLLCGTLADTFGRKRVLFFGALTFTLGGAIQTTASGYQSMVIGRIIAGFGVGALSMIVPTYQSEISPAENRGKLACIEFTINIIGYASSIWVDYFCSFIQSDASWRLPLSVQVIVGLTLAIGSTLLPESPRWLLDRDRDEDGMRVLADLHGSGNPREPRARLEYREIKENVHFMRSQGKSTYKTLFTRYKYRMFVACSALIFAQLNGINVVSYYAPIVFESAGWIGRDAILLAGINGILYVLSTIPPWYLVDRLGRRIMFMTGSVIMGTMLCLCAYFLYVDTSMTPKAVVVTIILYNSAHGMFGWSGVAWLVPPEIMPLAYRAKGTSISTAANWISNYVVGEATPILQEKIGWRLYVLHATSCLISLLVVYFTYPETMGVPLEEMDELFGDGGGPIPQQDDEMDEENQPLQSSRRSEDEDPAADGSGRQIRRSISSHPRFMSAEERIAREAAIKVAQLDRQESRRAQTWNPFKRRQGDRASVAALFGPTGSRSARDTTGYQSISREEG